MHALTWLVAASSLHLHLLVPSPFLGRRYRYLSYPLYALAIALAVLELWQLLPYQAFYLGLLLASVGSVGLLLIRLCVKTPPRVRLATRQMLAGVALAFGPGIVLWVIPSLLDVPRSGLLNLYLITFAASLFPFFYVYALYKHRLGGLEFRANRILSLFSFLVLYLTAFILVFIFGSRWVTFTPQSLGFALGLSMVFIIAGLFLREPFQRWIDRLAYGTEHNPDDVLRAFANEIPRALERDALVQLLTREVCPSLLIRQSALYLVGDTGGALFYSDGVFLDEKADVSEHLHHLLATATQYRPPEPDDTGPFSWVRLAIPIEVGGKRLGVWLLGRRDPDDYYPKPDIDLLATLGNQIGVALETSRLFESLRQRAIELERAYLELQELDQLKDEFVQNVSHELRTPLTFVRGYVELFLEGMLGELSPEQREALEKVADRTEDVIRLINDIISIQQAAVEKMRYEPVNMGALAQSCVEAAQLAVQRDGRGDKFEFILDVADDVPPIWGDRGRLRQVFDNLLGNAVKFSPDGGTITVRVRTRRYRFGDRGELPAVEVSVSDQGIGIPADKLERIWDRFYQVDGSTTRPFGGLGIGLAIVRNIIDAHGGVVWVESVVGEGTTFYFALPIHASPPQREDAHRTGLLGIEVPRTEDAQ
ncbi:MAG TPA: hypothetical protein G4O02_11890 [Caldilineae bacterium]|nr:hypothetical protein [Caldilineae bacterium]